MSNIYIKTIVGHNPSFGYVAKDNLTWSEWGKIKSGLIGRPEVTTPTRHHFARQLAYNMAKIPTPNGFERSRRKRRSVLENLSANVSVQESNAPGDTKTAAFMGSIIAHKLRLYSGNSGFAKIAEDLYQDGVKKRGVYSWSLKRKDRQKAVQDAYDRIAKTAKKLGYFKVDPKSTPKGSEERIVQGIIKQFANKSNADEMDFSDSMKEQLVHSPTDFLDVDNAAQMYKKYGMKHIFGEFFDSDLIKKLGYITAAGIVSIVGIKVLIK